MRLKGSWKEKWENRNVVCYEHITKQVGITWRNTSVQTLLRFSQLCGKSDFLGLGESTPSENSPSGYAECIQEDTAGVWTRTKSPFYLQKYEILFQGGICQVYFGPWSPVQNTLLWDLDSADSIITEPFPDLLRAFDKRASLFLFVCQGGNWPKYAL